MISRAGLLNILLLGVTAIVGSPALVPRQGPAVTSSSYEEVGSYKLYTQLARVAYCNTTQIGSWSCGTACNEIQKVQVFTTSKSLLAAKWFVGYYPPDKLIVVSNQGTAWTGILSSLADLDSFLTPLSPTLFPGVPGGVKVHHGFKLSQALDARVKLEAVRILTQQHPAATVTLTGLGHGGAISLLDALYFSLNLSSLTKFKVVTYGMPRVGNQAFADYIDSHLSDVSRITNKKDPIPTVPRSRSYRHSSGEKHISSVNGESFACPGQDNTDPQCSAGEVPNISDGDVRDHKGPYDGITIDDTACDA